MIFALTDTRGNPQKPRFCGMVKDINPFRLDSGCHNVRTYVPEYRGAPLSDRKTYSIYFDDPRHFVVVCPD